MKKEYGRHYKAEDPSLTGGINTVNGIISKSNLRMQCNPLQILIALFTRIEQILKLAAKHKRPRMIKAIMSNAPISQYLTK